jgi:hypothetical protein
MTGRRQLECGKKHGHAHDGEHRNEQQTFAKFRWEQVNRQKSQHVIDYYWGLQALVPEVVHRVYARAVPPVQVPVGYYAGGEKKSSEQEKACTQTQKGSYQTDGEVRYSKPLFNIAKNKF